MNVAFTGSTQAILSCMFPSRYDAHVEQWLKWRYLYRCGAIDKFGNNIGGKFDSLPCMIIRR